MTPVTRSLIIACLNQLSHLNYELYQRNTLKSSRGCYVVFKCIANLNIYKVTITITIKEHFLLSIDIKKCLYRETQGNYFSNKSGHSNIKCFVFSIAF